MRTALDNRAAAIEMGLSMQELPRGPKQHMRELVSTYGIERETILGQG